MRISLLLFLGLRLSKDGGAAAQAGLRHGGEQEDGIEGVVADEQSAPEDDGVPEDVELPAPLSEIYAAGREIWELHVNTVAGRLNIATDEAADFLKQQRAHAGLVGHLKDDANFLQAVLPDKPSKDLVLRYKNGDVPQESRERIQKHMATEYDNVKIVPSKLSLADAKGRRRRLVDKLETKGYWHVLSHIDADEIQVWVAANPQGQANPQGEANPQGQARRLETGEVHAALVAEILDLDSHHADLDGVKLFYTERNVQDDHELHHNYGGAKIYNENKCPGGQAGCDQCTAGWSANGPYTNQWGLSTQNGIVTAGHCLYNYNINRIDDPKYGGDVRTVAEFPSQQATIDRLGDLGWAISNHVSQPFLHVKEGPSARVLRVIGTENPHEGMSVCSYSRMHSKITCDQEIIKENIAVRIGLSLKLHGARNKPRPEGLNVWDQTGIVHDGSGTNRQTGLEFFDVEEMFSTHNGTLKAGPFTEEDPHGKNNREIYSVMTDGDSGGPYFVCEEFTNESGNKVMGVRAVGIHHGRDPRSEVCPENHPYTRQGLWCNMFSSVANVPNAFSGIELTVWPPPDGELRRLSNPDDDDDDGDGVPLPVGECFRRCEEKYGGDYTKGNAYYCSKGCARMSKGAVAEPTKWSDKAPTVRFDECISGCDDSSRKSSRREKCKFGCEYWCPDACIFRCIAKYEGDIPSKGDAYSCAKGCAGLSDGKITSPEKYCKRDEDDRYDECKEGCKSASSNTKKQDMCKYGCKYWDQECPHACIRRCTAKYGGDGYSGDSYSCAKGCAGMGGGEITKPHKFCDKDKDDRYEDCKEDCSRASSNTQKQDMCKYGCEYWEQ